MAHPRTAVFYSTIRHWNWGAPDYVWPIAAHRLLDHGISVLAFVRPQIRERPEIRALVARGARVLPQPPVIYRRGKISELRRAWSHFAASARRLRAATKAAPERHVFIDQSAAFDFLDEPLLDELVGAGDATYDVVFRLNSYGAPLSPERRRRAYRFLTGARRTLFNSSWTREVTETQLVHALPNAAYFDHHVRFPFSTPLPWPHDNVIRLASVSRIDSYHKGLDVLLQALALLPADLPAWTLDLYGDGPDREYLLELATFLGVSDRVRFQGVTEDVSDVWRHAHLLILVSRHEGLGVAMLEAMAAGRPVLRTPYGGCEEWIAHDETGFVCPAPEPRLIATTLADALRKFDRWPSLGEAAHARLKARLNPHPESVYLEAFGLGALPQSATARSPVLTARAIGRNGLSFAHTECWRRSPGATRLPQDRSAFAPLRPRPDVAVFYSTQRHWGWGAPDYVWPRAARTLLGQGLPVIAVVRPQIWHHPEIRALADHGADILLQPPLIYQRGRISEIRALLAQVTSSARTLHRLLRPAKRPHFFINQAASYDFLDETMLQRLLHETHASYDLFFHSNNYLPPLPLQQRVAAREFIGRAHRALFNSQWMRGLAEVQLASPIRNGGYFSCPVQFDYTEPLPWPVDATIRLASVSRIDSHHKGLDLLLRGLALLPETLPPWTLDFYGEGPDTGYLRELCEWLGLGRKVRFHPRVSDVREVWRQHHLLVLVSRYEGLAVAMLEAMACGRPVVRTPNGGFIEWIVQDETGFMCAAPEPRLIAASLTDAIGAFARWPEMGRTAHQKIRHELTRHPEAVFLEPFESGL